MKGIRDFQLVDYSWDGATYGIYILSFTHGIASYRCLLGLEYSDVNGFGICILFIWMYLK